MSGVDPKTIDLMVEKNILSIQAKYTNSRQLVMNCFTASMTVAIFSVLSP